MVCFKSDGFAMALQNAIGQTTVVSYRRPPSLLAFSEFLEPDEIWDLTTSTSHPIQYGTTAAGAKEYAGTIALVYAALGGFVVLILGNYKRLSPRNS